MPLKSKCEIKGCPYEPEVVLIEGSILVEYSRLETPKGSYCKQHFEDIWDDLSNSAFNALKEYSGSI